MLKRKSKRRPFRVIALRYVTVDRLKMAMGWDNATHACAVIIDRKWSELAITRAAAQKR